MELPLDARIVEVGPRDGLQMVRQRPALSTILLIGLFFGLRMSRELRGLLADVADLFQVVPGLGSRLLILVGAWYLLRLLRRHSGSCSAVFPPEALMNRVP